MTIEDLYVTACKMQTDINEHLPILHGLAKQCRHVTEFGTRAGHSTLAFLAAKPGRVVSYDLERWPQVDRLLVMARDERLDFQFYLEDCRLAEIEETDLLFIDTWHVEEQLRVELARHSAKVMTCIVLHDTESCGVMGETRGHRGLRWAVDEFLKRGTFKIVQHRPNNNGLTVLRRVAPESAAKEPLPIPPANVFLGIPFYAAVQPQILDQWEKDAVVDPFGQDSAHKAYSGSAFHCHSFNDLWCAALNTRPLWTHFAMVHTDVRPEGCWLSTMLREMRENEADLLSVVMPIKTEDGLTSTAVLDKKTMKVKRLTLKQCAKMPVTFDADTAAKVLGLDECLLLTSTGLWICDFTKPWVERVWFESRHRIVKGADADWRPETVSEDWAFAHALHLLGLKVMATRAVPAGHWGVKCFYNFENIGLEEDSSEEAYGDWYKWQRPA